MSMRISALVAILVATPLIAEEKAPAKPIGTWTREVGDHKISYTFNADATMRVVVERAGKKIDVAGNYGMTKEGVVYGIFTKVESDLGAGPEKGDLFSIGVSVADKELTISDLKGTRVNEGAKKVVEGVYTKK